MPFPLLAALPALLGGLMSAGGAAAGGAATGAAASAVPAVTGGASAVGGGLMSAAPESMSFLSSLGGLGGGGGGGGSDTDEIAKDNMAPFIQESMMHSQKGADGATGGAAQAQPGPSYTGLQGLMNMVGPTPQRQPNQVQPGYENQILRGLMGVM